MKKAFSTLACQALGYKEVAELALQEGIHAFEVRLHKENRFFDLPIEEVPGAIAYLGDKIVHTHIKDGIRYEDPDLILCKCTKLGEGTVPIAEIISLLKDVGYDGYYSLEWESAWREEIRDTFKSLPELLRHFNDYMEKFGA